MFPFFPSLPNQAQPQGATTNRVLQQAMLSNHQFMSPPLPSLTSFNGNNPRVPSRPPLMPPPVVQNSLNPALALLLQGQLGGVQQNVEQLLRQQSLLGLLPNSSLAAPVPQGGGVLWGQNLCQSVNQMVGLHGGQFGLPNMMMNGNQVMASQCSGFFPVGVPLLAEPSTSQNSGFIGNSYKRVNNLNLKGQNAGKESQGASQKSQPQNAHGPTKMHQGQKNFLTGGLQQSQVHHVDDRGKRITNVNSENSTSKNFTRNFQGHGRFHNSQCHKMKNAKGSFRTSSKNGGRGQHNWRDRKPHFTKCSEEPMMESKRHQPVIYTEKEIQQWREERRKNFPTKAKTAKKLAGSHEDTEEDTKLRCQQLKEIMAKQAELGVEVADLPPGYLSEGENQACERKNERWNNQRKERDPAGRYPNKYNKRGKHGQDRCLVKRQKSGDDASTSTICTREPTLLQKLLSADIKRDKSKLLQVFRFMVLNSFFEHWPDKPLEFPVITVKEMECMGEVARENGISLDKVDAAALAATKDVAVNKMESLRDASSLEKAAPEDGVGNSDSISNGEMENHMAGDGEHAREGFEKSEEGEVTE